MNDLAIIAAPKVYARTLAARPRRDVLAQIGASLERLVRALPAVRPAAVDEAERLAASWPKDAGDSMPPDVVAGARRLLTFIVEDPRALPANWDDFDFDPET